MNRIRARRKEKNLTMKELGDLIGCSESTISNYENGKREPDNATLIAIAERLETTVDYLLCVTDDPSMPNEKESMLEALHQNPRLGMLFDRSKKMNDDDVDFMIQMADRILRERDGD